MRLSNERITGFYRCFTFASFRVSCVSAPVDSFACLLTVFCVMSALLCE